MSYAIRCGSGINTRDKFTRKCGYLETRCTAGLDDSDPQNMALVIGDYRRDLKFPAANYGVPVGNHEELSRLLPTEINLFECFPERQRELTNGFYNDHTCIFYTHRAALCLQLDSILRLDRVDHETTRCPVIRRRFKAG